MTVIQRLLRFAVVGTAGFTVDTSVLLLLVRFGALSPMIGRVVSFVIAATVTFVLNQRFTFRVNASFSIQRWAYYVAITALGAVVNLGVYRLWILSHGSSALDLIAGTAMGSLTAMAINYSISSAFVFRPAKQTPATPAD